MGSCLSSPEAGKRQLGAKHNAAPPSAGEGTVKAFATAASSAATSQPSSKPGGVVRPQDGNGSHNLAAVANSGAAEDAPAFPLAAEGPLSNGSVQTHSAQLSPSAAASDANAAAASAATAPTASRPSSSSRRQGPNVPRRRGSASNLRRGGGAASRRSSNAGVDDGVALPLTAAQMGEAGEDTAIAPPPPPMALDSAAGDSASSTSTVRSRNASYTAGAPDGVAAAGSKPPVGSGLSRLGFAGPAAAAAAAAALTDAGPGPGRGPGTPSSREVPWLAPGGSRSGGVEGASGGEESDAVPDMAGARLSRLGDRSSGSGAPAGGPPLPAGTSVPLPSPGVRGAALPFSASMPHGPRAPGQLQPVASGAPAAAPAQRDASAFRFDPALLASLRLAPSGSVSSSVPPSDSAYGAPADPGTAGPGDHPRPGAAHHLSFTHHAGRPQGHPSGVVTCSEDTDTDGRPSESGPSYAGLGGVRPSKASFTSRPPPGPNSARRRGGEALQPRPSSGAHLEAVATAAANQVAALLQNPLPSIPSGGLAPGAEDPGIQTLLSLGLVNAAAYRRARQRASEAGGAGVANVGPGGGGGGGAAGSGPQHFAYQQQMMMAQMPGGSPGPGVPGRKMRRSSCTEAYGHGRYAHPQQGYGYGSPHNRQLQNLGTMSRAEGGNSGGGGGGGGGRSHLNADAAFGMVRRTASVAMSKDAQAAIAAAAAAATAAADAQGAGGNSGRGRQRRMSYNVAV